MATSPNKIDTFNSLLTENKKILFTELDHLNENCRWLTTLVVAEIAGIAAYRKLIAENSLSIPLALIIFTLAVVIVCFMLGIYNSRISKTRIAKIAEEQIRKANEINSDGTISPNHGDQIINKISCDTIIQISKTIELTKTFEMSGIIAFILTTLGTTFIIFSTEFISLFR